MAANTSPIFIGTPKTAAQTFANADATALKTLYTAGANGSRIMGIGATTTDTSANDVELYVLVGGVGTAQPIGGGRVAALAGSIAAPVSAAVSLLSATQIPMLLSDGSLQLGAADILQASVQAAVTAAKTLTVVVQAGDY